MTSKNIPEVKINPFSPVEKWLAKMDEVYTSGHEVLKLKGLPIPLYCFRHPDQATTLLKQEPMGTTKYPLILPRVKHVMGRGGYILKGNPEWKAKRQQVQAAFKGKCMSHYTDCITGLSEELVATWKKQTEKENTLDICHGLQLLITKLSFKMFFSHDIAEEDLERIREQTHFIEMNFLEPMPLWVPTPRVRKFIKANNGLRKYMAEVVQKRISNPGSSDDVLSTLIGLDWTETEIVDEMCSIYFGASVMSTTIAWCLYKTSGNNKAQDNAIAEIKDVLGGKAFSFSDLKTLSHPQMIFQETARLFPPSWGYPRHCEEDFEIDGYKVAKNSLVVPMVYFSQRHPDFWSEPEAFKPERFAADAPEKINRQAYYPFGSGPRTCLGAGLASVLIPSILAILLQNFRFSFQPRFDGDPIIAFGFEIHPKDKVMMKLETL